MRIMLALLGLLAFQAGLAGEAPAATPANPAWRLSATMLPTVLPHGVKGELFLLATNVGGAQTSAEAITLTDTLPSGLSILEAKIGDNDPASPTPAGSNAPCNVAAQTVTCIDLGPLGSGHHLEARVIIEAKAATEGSLPDEASVEGGGGGQTSAATSIEVGPGPAAFDFLTQPAGFSTPLTEADGSAAVAAGSHPYSLTIDAGFPTEKNPGGVLVAAGHLRDISVDLPRGMVIDPQASALCSEEELVRAACPPSSAVGTITIRTVEATVKATTSPIYNMVPPPGEPAELGFDALSIGVYIHLSGTVRNDGDYGLTGGTREALALTNHPVFGARVELWGYPSDPSHDTVRAQCVFAESVATCPTGETHRAFLTTPTECSGQANESRARADSWEEPSVFKEASYESATLEGNPAALSGCGELDFSPTIEARPSTNLADSPAGLEVGVHQPQDLDPTRRATAIMKDAALTLPEGLVVNPSRAEGLAACTPAQMGLTSAIGQTPIRFSKPAAQCPEAAKLGSVQVSTPLLGHSLPGSIYLAQPFQNPFGSLLAIYLTVDDPESGVVAKLAGQVHADPITGQLSTTFSENPELPIEDVRVTLFGGARGALRTPPACTTYTTTSNLIPWSAPEGPDAHPADSFAVTALPGGGGCPSSADGAPNAPTFTAGTIDPAAAAYTPLAMKLSRADGSQPLAGFETTLPGGLLAKLAGVPYCTEGQIAQAKARSNPNEGTLEQANPSCPGASQIGSLDVAAGAGPTPFHTGGRVYLAGPYKGAPLSAVTITPAIAGPFDLGAVVVRAALYVDPERARARAVSDPLPQILDGIPLDLRSAAVQLDRPQFTLNPTNCEEKSIEGAVTSSFGQIAHLKERFQVGGCQNLAFKPKLSLRLRGQTKRTGHPAIIGTLRSTPGQANPRRISVTLPRSEFLDQAHIGTVCTRVQFAANQCPAASVYGHVRVSTPLLDQPLEGPAYLRSSSHELPDLVLALHGQVDVVLDGRIDSVNGGIRTTFEEIPDAPFTKAVLTMRGGRKGLLINSANLCKLKPRATRATVLSDGQNGAVRDFQPVVGSDCKAPKHRRHHRR